MRKFVLNSILFSFFLLVGIIGILTWIDAKGLSDEFYKRLNHSSPSIILGSSRAAQGIVPEVLQDSLSEMNFATPLENFSFTIIASPYSSTYYRAIKKKLIPQVESNGLYVLDVTPYSLRNDRDGERERWDILCGATIQKPNYPYLLRYCRPYKWLSHKSCLLHDDGWLEVRGIPLDSIWIENALKDGTISLNDIEIRKNHYIERMAYYRDWSISKSNERINWLIKTITLLKAHGTVYLVRIPVSQQMKEIEDSIWPDFDKDIISIANSLDISYFSFTEQCNQYRTVDGNHLYYEDAIKFSAALCDSIKHSFTSTVSDK